MVKYITLIISLTINTMKLSKKYLETLFLITKGTEGVLSLSESRIRDSFIKNVSKNLQEFYDQSKAIFETFCDKTEDGKPKIVENNYSFAPEKKEDIEKELKTLIEETVELEDVKGIKKILEKTEYKPKVGEMELIDELLAKLPNK